MVRSLSDSSESFRHLRALPLGREYFLSDQWCSPFVTDRYWYGHWKYSSSGGLVSSLDNISANDQYTHSSRSHWRQLAIQGSHSRCPVWVCRTECSGILWRSTKRAATGHGLGETFTTRLRSEHVSDSSVSNRRVRSGRWSNQARCRSNLASDFYTWSLARFHFTSGWEAPLTICRWCLLSRSHSSLSARNESSRLSTDIGEVSRTQYWSGSDTAGTQCAECFVQCVDQSSRRDAKGDEWTIGWAKDRRWEISRVFIRRVFICHRSSFSLKSQQHTRFLSNVFFPPSISLRLLSLENTRSVVQLMLVITRFLSFSRLSKGEKEAFALFEWNISFQLCSCFPLATSNVSSSFHFLHCMSDCICIDRLMTIDPSTLTSDVYSSWPTDGDKFIVVIRFPTSLIRLSLLVSLQLGKENVQLRDNELNGCRQLVPSAILECTFSSLDCRLASFLLYIDIRASERTNERTYMLVSNSTDKFKQHARLKTNTGNNHSDQSNRWVFLLLLCPSTYRPMKLHHIQLGGWTLN